MLFGGVTSGGDGWMLLPSGQVVRIPPRSPFVTVMNQIAAITEAEQRLSHAGGPIAVHALYTGLVRMVESAAKARIAQAPSLKLRE